MNRTTRRLTVIVTVLFLVVLATPLHAGKPAGGSTSTTSSVTSTIDDYDATNQAYYNIRSDYEKTGTYVYTNGIDSVVSAFQRTGAYELSAANSATRRMFVDFGVPVPGSFPDPDQMFPGAATNGYVAGRFISKFDGINSMKGVGTSLKGGFLFHFIGYDGKEYRIQMDSSNGVSNDVTVTCTAVDASDQCNAWTASPDGDAIGRLTKFELVKRNWIITWYGTFHLPFKISFTRP